jgi:hypothetical protein
MDRIVLRTRDLLAYFKKHHQITSGYQLAPRLGVTRQALNKWKRYVPELTARRIIDEFPELAQKAQHKPSPPPRPRHVGRRVRG